ncbi:MAG: rhomboid family intramembrane serine protease, partial [Bradymonadaceae bacterium]
MIPLRGEVERTRRPWLTMGLIGINTLVFFIFAGLDPDQQRAVIQTFGAVAADQGEAFSENPWAIWVWLLPLSTSMFLHGGFLHLGVNMLFLWVFGEGVESRLGRVKYFLFYLGAGVGAAQVQIMFMPDSPIPMIGASGAVAGVLAMYALMYPRARLLVVFPIIVYPVFFTVPAMVYIVLWFIYQIASGLIFELRGLGEGGGVAWWAHAGGFMSGLFCITLFARDTLASRHEDEEKMRGIDER